MMPKEKSKYKIYDSHRIKFADFFKAYEYKCRDLTSSTVPMNPYFNKSQTICDHKFSLTKTEWMVIMRCYIKYLKQLIIQGYMYKMPHNLGHLFILKYRSASKIDWVETRKRKKLTKYKNDHSDGQTIAVKWKRSSMPWLAFWKIEPNISFRRDMGKALAKNISLINNYTK